MRFGRPTRSWVPPAMVLLAVLLAVTPLVPASPDPVDFSTDRAMALIGEVGAEPHPIGSPANEVVRNRIVSTLAGLGLEPVLQSVEVPDYFGAPGATVTVVNVMASIPGASSTGSVAVVGHYDTVPTSPGANDNASAVAILLETARALAGGPQLANDVILLFTDGEEPAPRFGSSAFVNDHPWARNVGFVVNLEAIGSGGPSLLVETSGPGAWVLDRYVGAVPHPVAFSFLTATSELIGGSNTDFAPFRDDGIAGLELVYLHGSSIYHTLRDDAEHVSRRSLTQHGTATLGLVRELGNTDLGSVGSESRDEVFFTLGRGWVIRHPSSWMLPLLVAAGVGLVIVARAGSPRRILLAAGRSGIVTVATMAVVAGLWSIVAAWRDGMGIGESYLYLGWVVVAAAMIGQVAGAPPNEAGAAGVVTLWWSVAVLTTLLDPGIGYLFAWPVVVATLTLVVSVVGSRSDRHNGLGSALVTAVALAVTIPAVDLFFQLAGPRPGNTDSQILAAVVIPAMLIALLVALVRAFWPTSRAV